MLYIRLFRGKHAGTLNGNELVVVLLLPAVLLEPVVASVILLDLLLGTVLTNNV